MYDLIIIGGGPAGLTAALYAGRARLKTLLIEKAALGGQLNLTLSIENFPGFPGGIVTEKLISLMKKQAVDLGVEIKTDEITGLTFDTEFKAVGSDAGYQSKAVVVACGADPKRLDIPGEERLTGRGVSYCATCDAPLFKNKEVAVVGGGDKAVEEAIYLAKYAKKVTLIHRRDQLRASRILQERMFQNKKIEVLWKAVPLEITGEKSVEALKVKDVSTEKISDLMLGGVFIFVGINPHTSFLRNMVKLDEQGFILTGEDMQTSCQGLFAAGDCRKKALTQVITACADGAVAAFSANRYLDGK